MSQAVWDRSRCSVAGTLAVVGEKWSLLVLREAFLGVRPAKQYKFLVIATAAEIGDNGSASPHFAMSRDDAKRCMLQA